MARDREFMKLWVGQTVSVFGSMVTRTALPFTAILVLGATPFQMGLLNAADLLPGIALGLVAGAWVDRLRRKPILIAADLARAALLISIPIAALASTLRIEHLYVVALLVGACTILFDVAYLSYLPSLVPRERLVEANARLEASASVAEVGAFGATGWLVQWLGAPAAIVIDAVTFLFSAGSLASIRAREPDPPARSERRRRWRELIEGLRATFSEPELRTLAGSVVIHELSLGIGGAVFMVFVTRELGFEPGALGMFFAVGGVSAMLGAFAAAPLGARAGVYRVMIAGLVVSGLATLLVPLARGATATSAVLLIAQQLIGDAGAVIYSVHQISRRQAITPEHSRGRVNAGIRVLGLSLALVGALGGGLLAEAFGLRSVLVLAGCARIVAGSWLVVGRRGIESKR